VSSTAAANSDYDFSAGLPLLDRPSRVRRARRAFIRYLIAICVGAAATLAWQSYGDAIKQTVATKAPELGWSPEVSQLIATSVERLGWTKPAQLESGAPPTAAPETAQQAPVTQAATAAPEATAQQAPVAQAAANPVVSNPPAGPSPALEQVQQMASDLAALKQAVERLSANQDRMAQDIAKVQAMDQEVLNKVSANKVAANNKAVTTKVSASPPQATAMPTHKHLPALPQTAAMPTREHPPASPTASAPPAPIPPQPLPLR
jgi:hypothetical protein